MPSTYLNADTHSTGGTSLGPAGVPVCIKKITIGKPTSNGNIWIYGEINPANSANTSGLVAVLTMPSAVPTTQVPLVYDFTQSGNEEMALYLYSGGNVMLDTAQQVTVQWETAEDQN